MGSHLLESRNFLMMIKIKFLLLIFKHILIFCVYFTYDENIFSGLSIMNIRGDNNYKVASTVLLIGLTFYFIFALVELLILMVGYTTSFNKNNIIILALNVFAVFLLLNFIIGGWHYVIIWYIFIVAQVPQTMLEVYGFFYAIIYQFAKYNKIKTGVLKPITISK